MTRGQQPRPLPPHLPMMTQINANWISDEAHYRKEDPCLELQREIIDGQALLILQRIDKRYLRYFVGVEMARLLRQQTYNMYRSMKSRGIELIRANQNVLSYLRQQKAVPRNTHSVTLVPYAEGMKFILERLRERQKIEKQNQVALGLLSSPPPAKLHLPKSSTPPPTPSPSHFSSFPVASSNEYLQPPPVRESRSQSPPTNFQLPAPIPTKTVVPPQHFKPPPLPQPFPEMSSLRSLSEVSVARVVENSRPLPLQQQQKPMSAPVLPSPSLLKQQQQPSPSPAPPSVVVKREDPSTRRGEELRSGGWLQLLLNSTEDM